MKPIALATALVLMLAAAPAAAQARVNVWFGIGVPGPYESGLVVVRPRRPYYPYYREHEYYRDHDRAFYDAPRGMRRGYWGRHRQGWHRDRGDERE
ncbi:MAG TPA: hypothetical protein VH116_10705 [Gemmatimonadales bacterium]|jgi:hypothetical protein|nr:hypothetical protein [Gemmatimonadales bacterium]